MLEPRLIPLLLLAGRRLVKTTRFEDATYVGDPINTIRIFNDKQVDELAVLGIDVSPGQPDLSMLEDLAAEAFMPLTYGGGIDSRETARQVLSVGIEKVTVRRAAFERRALVSELAEEFGSQAVVAALDVRMESGVGVAYVPGSALPTIPVHTLVPELVSQGAGEILVQSVERDGTMAGMDHPLIRQVVECAGVPVIAAGGLASLQDAELAYQAGADAVAGGAFFVFRGKRRAVLLSYPRRSQMPWLLNE